MIKKILFVVTNADLAGAPIHVKDLVIELVRINYNIRVVFGELGPIKSIIENEGIETHLLPTMRSKISPVDDIKSIIGLMKIVKDFQPDLIHAHSSKAGLITKIAGIFSRIPVLYTVHGWGFGSGRRFTTSALTYLSELLLSKATTHYITVSEADKKLGIKLLGLEISKITCIRNASSFYPTRNTKIQSELNVIMVARNEYPKDYETFFKSLDLVDVDCVRVVGKGTDNFLFVENARSLTIKNANKIEFLGIRNDVNELLNKSTIFVLSTRFEGLPISIIEAMSNGLPIIASNVGGIPELVKHGINGYLFQPGDYLDLAKYLNKLINDGEKRQKFGDISLKRFAEEFTLEVMVKKTDELYLLLSKK